MSFNSRQNKKAILIQDHNKNKIIYASSDDKRIIKKIMKLPWNVFENLNASIQQFIVAVLLKYNNYKYRRQYLVF